MFKPIKNSDRIEKLMSITNEQIAQAIMETTMRELGRDLLRGNIERSQIKKHLKQIKVLTSNFAHF